MQLKWPMRWDLFSLFPAYAGVIPSRMLYRSIPYTFPRIRGGDPSLNISPQYNYCFSPHTRG